MSAGAVGTNQPAKRRSAARSVVDAQDFENRMLKACIRGWPEGQACGAPPEPDSKADPA